jgi:hypothetical protein
MAATRLTDAMDAIVAAVGAISGLKVNLTPTDANMPLALVHLPNITKYHSTFHHGKFDGEMAVTILCGKQIDQVGLRQVAAFADAAGASSVHAAIEADVTLGGVVENCIVQSFAPLDGNSELGRLGFVGVTFTLMVIGKGA